jgi:hypothetical protein
VEPDQQPSEPRPFLRGRTGLIAALAVVTILLVWLPAYRWFFVISIGIGLIVACGLHFWNKFKPVKEKDIENKRPLGLE